jgi:hypothetical protein
MTSRDKAEFQAFCRNASDRQLQNIYDKEMDANRKAYANIAAAEAETMRVSLRRVRINGGGYDDGGAYWGHGQPLYWAGDDDGIIDIWFRARDRDDAKAQVRARCPNAMFYR